MTSLGTTSVPAIPDSRIARDATDLIRSVESDLLYHHSLRVYRWGALQGALRGLRDDPGLLYIGAMFHDTGGLVEGYRSEHDRFEVDGANAAREFLREHGVSGDALRTVWDAIALHTTPRYPGNTRCPKSLWLRRRRVRRPRREAAPGTCAGTSAR